MKETLLYLAFLTFFNCSSNTSSENDDYSQKKETSKNDLTDLSNFDTTASFPHIPLIKPSKEEIKKFEEFLKGNNIKTMEISDSPDFEYNKRSFLDEFFNFNEVRGASIYFDSAKQIRIHDLYYQDSTVKSNFENILKIIEKKERVGYDDNYHFFFKRGLLILLDEKKSKISIISFNIFGDPKNINIFTRFFENTKNRFDASIIILGSSSHSTIHINE